MGTIYDAKGTVRTMGKTPPARQQERSMYPSQRDPKHTEPGSMPYIERRLLIESLQRHRAIHKRHERIAALIHNALVLLFSAALGLAILSMIGAL